MSKKNSNRKTSSRTRRTKRLLSFLYKLVVITLILIIIVSGALAFNFFRKEADVRKDQNEIQEIVENNIGSIDPDKHFSKDAFETLKTINDDFICYIDFDSGLLSLPVAQATDNDYYLRRNLNKDYSALGIPFMDYRCSPINQNITIYGHNSIYDEKVMFSPIRKLLDQEVFNKNDKFKIYFADEVRDYQIVAMYYYNIEADNIAERDFAVLAWPNLKSFNTYFSWVESKNLIKSNVIYDSDDNFVTFQTCRSYQSDERLVVVAKEMNCDKYD